MFSSPLVLQIPSSMQMTDEQFFEFSQVNRDLRIERNKLGELVIMPPIEQKPNNDFTDIKAAKGKSRKMVKFLYVLKSH